MNVIRYIANVIISCRKAPLTGDRVTDAANQIYLDATNGLSRALWVAAHAVANGPGEIADTVDHEIDRAKNDGDIRRSLGTHSTVFRDGSELHAGRDEEADMLWLSVTERGHQYSLRIRDAE